MSDFIASLQSLSTNNSDISIEDIAQLIKQMPATITPSELHEFINFISEQVGIFETEWEFSPLRAPNMDAKRKADAWAQLWKTCSNMLVELAPDLRDSIERKHHLVILGHAIAKGLDLNKEKPVQKLASAGLSKIAIGLNSIGLSGLANRLYQRALYPSGSVGRSGN